MDPVSRQIRKEASTELAVVMRKGLGEKWRELSDKNNVFYKVRRYLLHSTNGVTGLVFFNRTAVSVIFLLSDISIRKFLLNVQYVKINVNFCSCQKVTAEVRLKRKDVDSNSYRKWKCKHWAYKHSQWNLGYFGGCGREEVWCEMARKELL
jgi:hypothetical protein